MKISLYNRWLSTMGGGERHSLAIASHLARSHDVDVLTHIPFDPIELSNRLDVDLTGVRFRVVPLGLVTDPGPHISGYDLFINASNGDYIEPLAKRNAILVYFPTQSPVRLGQRLRRYVASQMNKLAIHPRYVSGVFGTGDAPSVGSHGLAHQAQIALPAASVKSYTAEFTLEKMQNRVDGASIYIDDLQVEEFSFNAKQTSTLVRLSIPPGPERMMTIVAHGGVHDGTVPLTISSLQLTSRRARVYKRIFVDAWPELSVRYENTMPADIPAIIRDYDLVWANSRYTQRWIRAYWNLPSTLLYPPVPVEKYPPHAKKPYILSVGRFFAGNHNKKHLVMVETFKRMAADGLRGWELHLAGNVTPGTQHQRYLAEVQAAATGSPVRIHTDIDNADLIKLFGESAIYWHAAGYGENPTRNPGKFEHFGMSVVEAMAAGCAPIVVGQGGLTELVQHECNGFLWYEPQQLSNHTLRLIADTRLRSQIAQAAIVSSRRFDEAHFRTSLDQSLAALLE